MSQAGGSSLPVDKTASLVAGSGRRRLQQQQRAVAEQWKMGQLAVAVAAAVFVRSLDQGTCRTRLCHASNMTGMARPRCSVSFLDGKPNMRDGFSGLEMSDAACPSRSWRGSRRWMAPGVADAADGAGRC